MPRAIALTAQKSLQPGEYSTGSVLGGARHTCDSDGNRLNLNWHDGRLNCDSWNFDDNPNGNVAVFALMV